MRDALALLTTFGRRDGGGTLHARALQWFPLVGVVLGAITGTVWWIGQQWWPRPVAAALALVADAACTGLLHYDGVVDAADGLLPHATRERRLAIMRAPDVGAFGIVTVALVLILQATALSSRAANVWLIIALWCAARALVAAVPAVVPYARADGIASSLIAGARAWAAFAVVPAIALAAVALGWPGAIVIAVASLAGVGVIAFAWRRLGGFSGDVLGAAIVLAQTAGLVVAAAKW